MKKIFNLAVILATLMGGATFTSCDDDKEDAEKNVTEKPEPYINVVEGGEYSASNKALDDAFTFKVTKVSGTSATKTQVVSFTIDGVKDKTFTLSDAGASYLVSLGEGNYMEANNAALKEGDLYDSVVMCLALSNKKTSVDYEINSASINDTCKDKGASETLFSKNNRKANKN